MIFSHQPAIFSHTTLCLAVPWPPPYVQIKPMVAFLNLTTTQANYVNVALVGLTALLQLRALYGLCQVGAVNGL